MRRVKKKNSKETKQQTSSLRLPGLRKDGFRGRFPTREPQSPTFPWQRARGRYVLSVRSGASGAARFFPAMLPSGEDVSHGGRGHDSRTTSPSHLMAEGRIPGTCQSRPDKGNGIIMMSSD